MFGISGFKLIIILIGAMVLLGPDKLPEMARTVGKFIQMFNSARAEMEAMIKPDLFSREDLSSNLLGNTEITQATTASTLYGADEPDEEEEE